MKYVCTILSVVGLLLFATACKQQPQPQVVDTSEEDKAAKQMLQGVWVDELTGEVSFRAKGDTIYYADATSLPAYFRVIGDTLELGRQGYLLVTLTDDCLAFLNQTGDEVRLVKGDEEMQADTLSLPQPQVLQVNEVVQRDSVVMYGGERYHWYIYVNPTKYRVTRTATNTDGVEIEKEYYDNIIHVSLFQGKRKLFSQNFSKKMYANDVPEQFLTQAILGNMQYTHVDAEGFHFDATICIPDEASCYVVETLVGIDGNVSMRLLDY
ncbi:MAG: DUF4738 domain-containing protein [Prevotella sp.]|nr:DUF4738 domain-containing protein [Prevotella sp.]